MIPIENQVVDLGLSKKLKEAGYKQEGVWWWQWEMEHYVMGGVNKTPEGMPYLVNNKPPFAFPFEGVVAPTVAELGEALKEFINDYTYDVVDYTYDVNEKCWVCSKYREQFDDWEHCLDKTEANARAKMWLYLKKEGLI